MHKFRKLTKNRDYIKSSVFGIEDSLVSTTGVIAGVAAASSDQKIVIVAGLVTIAVEAVSMAAGEFISEETEVEMTPQDKTSPVLSGLVMFVSYFVAGFIPMLPVLLFPLPYSVYLAIIAALIGLFILGLIKGRLTKSGLIKSGIKVALVGGIATALGIAVGLIFKV